MDLGCFDFGTMRFLAISKVFLLQYKPNLDGRAPHPDPLPARGGEREKKQAYPFVILSISARSSALSAQSIALTFCSTCSTRVAPAITLATCGREASQENASSSRVCPRAFAKACSFSTMSSLRGVT